MMATATAAVLNAMVIGGTGATGRCLMGALLRDKERFGKVVLFTRRKIESVAEEYNVNLTEEEESGRLVQHVQDLDEITKERITELCNGCHVFFNALGTTRSAAGSSQAFYHIDCEIPVKFAEAAKEAGVSHMSLLTSLGAKASSFFLYLRTKGELEEKIRELHFSHTTIFQPGTLARGATTDYRILERLAGVFIKGLPVSRLAAAMAWDAVVSAQKGQTSGEPTVTTITSNGNVTAVAQEYLAIFASKSQTEETQPQEEEAEPQTEGTQPQEGESPAQVQETQPGTEEIQPQAQAEEARPQVGEAEETHPETEETQPQVEESQP